jgi:pimeloyl-ACP methyl ester carboxylesterase
MPFISLPDIKIHYEVAGNGETAVVLVHGNIASWRWWLPVLENPPAGCTVYAPDMRGFGDSEHTKGGYNIEQFATDLDAFVNELALDHIHLVGHSLGAAVALQYAVQYPHKMRKLLLVSPPPAEGMTYSLQEDRKIFGIPLPLSAENIHLQHSFRNSHIDRAILSHALTRITPGMDHRSKFFADLVGDAYCVSRETLKGAIHSLGNWTVQDRLPALNMTVLILWGDKDTVVKRAPLERMARDIPHAELVVWEGIGHAPQLEQPGRFHVLLTEFTAQKTTMGIKKCPAVRFAKLQARKLWRWSHKLWKK